MKIINSSEQLRSRFRDLFMNYDHFSCLSAWAGANFYEHKVLKNHQNKIQKMVVGTHMFHTSPQFIEDFIGVDGVRFWKPSGDLFHPKVYLFFNGGEEVTRWSVLIGSANFSSAGFNKNKEVLVEINHLSADLSVFSDLLATIDKYWDEAPTWTQEYLDIYRDQYRINKPKVRTLQLNFDTEEDQKTPSKDMLDSKVYTMRWDEFIVKIKAETEHKLEDRLFVLDRARKVWEGLGNDGKFSDLELDDRKFLAGLPCSDDRAAYFGSMRGAGEFHKAVNNNNPIISEALDFIPLEGEVNHEHYRNFVEKFSELDRSGLATATRLLTMKRPDVFVCVDSKNLDKLCDDFGILKSIGLEEYWEKIITRIQGSTWWNHSVPNDSVEAQIYRSRAAFLDSLYYVWEA